MRFNFMPPATQFFDMLDEATAILTRASTRFVAMLTDFDRLVERGGEIREDELALDDVVGRIIQTLDRTFVTPFDREDIHSLASRLDDVMDNLEETAHRFAVVRIDKPTSETVVLARIIRDCCLHLAEAIRLCRTRQHVDLLKSHLREIRRLESEADHIYRDTAGRLFANPPAILMLIKLRELYGWLEETVDACKDVSHILSAIVIKGM